MAKAVFFWPNACPALTVWLNCEPMARPHPNWNRHSANELTAIMRRNVMLVSACNMFFIVVPDTISSEHPQR